ncbi:MAG: hypothetical protein MK119_05645 [Kordia sp.]|nr:hypothetical protein [Kordia sp.]
MYLNVSVPVIWSFKASNNYKQELSIFSSTWDTLLVAQSGTSILYSFWRDTSFGFQQVINLNEERNKPLEIGLFSPQKKADTTIVTSGTVHLQQYQSFDYFVKEYATVRLTSKSDQSELLYCMFGLHSVVAVALNTSKEVIPPSYEGIKNIEIVNSNQYEIRNKWGAIKIFVVYLHIVDGSSVKVAFSRIM